MYKILLLLVTLLCLTSCATLVNKKTYDIEVTSTTEGAKLKVYDTIYSLPAKVKAIRSKEDLKLTLIADNLTKEYLVNSRISPQTNIYNLAFVYFYPVGYAVDLTTDRRFFYGKKLNLNANDTITRIGFKKEHPLITKKGDILIAPHIPLLNSFYLHPEGQSTKSQTGTVGIGFGVEYYYKDNKYVRFNVSACMDAIILPVFYDELMTNINFSLTDNFKFNRLNLGYGLNFSLNSWKKDISPDLENSTYYTKTSGSFGPTVSGTYQVYKPLYAGLTYSGAVYNIYPKSEFKYQHVISFVLELKLFLKKIKR